MKLSKRRDEMEDENVNYEIKRKNREMNEYIAHLAGFKSRDEMTEYIRIHGDL